MPRRLIALFFIVIVTTLGRAAGPASDAALERDFTQTVRPFVLSYCVVCHSGAAAQAQFDLKSYTKLSEVVRDFPRWSLVIDKLSAQQMPPKEAKQPDDAARKAVIAWVQSVRKNEARKHAGEPGTVLAHRLSNSEYNYTIRDLTGVDIRPTREFPVDPANPAGFDNSGESLMMSPALLTKYLAAAREVADHLVFTPTALEFAPNPMLVETDRDQYAIARIVEFYLRQPTDLADYFEACWRFRNRAALGKPRATLNSIAAEMKLSPKYLPMVWEILEATNEAGQQEVGPIGKLQAMWHELPAPDQFDADAFRAKCMEMRQFVTKTRQHTGMQYAAPVVRDLPPGSQPLLDWKLREFAAHRRDFDPDSVRNDTDPEPVLPARLPRYADLHQEAGPRWAALMARARAADPDLVVPFGDRGRYEEAFRRFAYVFPDNFYVKERGRYFPDDSQDRGRLLSASYHNVMGYFRDDTPLMELILDEKGQKELNRLWDEFDFIAAHTARTWEQYYFNQSGELAGDGAEEEGSPRPVGMPIYATPVIMGLRDKYVFKAQQAWLNDPAAVQAINEHFEGVDHVLRRMEQMHKDAEPRHLDALVKFAARAYRRPLTQPEQAGLIAYYHALRDKDGLSHEDAIRDSITSVLMSPKFCYRFAPAPLGRPLSAYALANRLSYFLWSSMPDKELLAHAKSGDLVNPTVLLAQTRRMLKDDRAIGLATEFGGNWLDFRQFEQINTVDRERFPSFTNNLREAMFQEPIHFLDDVIRNNRSVLDLLYANRTFVNPALAKHYGMPYVGVDNAKWTRIDNAGQYGEGGLLPMSVFLTQNAPGLRTSPVKRGYWVAKRVLGENIPPPPATVPELPKDEAKMDAPLRDILAQHRQNPACAGCHARFDTFGLAFENYGPIGEKRSQDLAGHAVDTHAVFPGGVPGAGVEGMQTYIREHRQQDFLDNLSGKLLAYALGRSLQLSDDVTIEQMEAKLTANGYRFQPMVEVIVTSPQFLNKGKTQ